MLGIDVFEKLDRLIFGSEEKERVINVSAVKEWLEIKGAAGKPTGLMVTEEGIREGRTKGKTHSNTFGLGVILSVEEEKSIFCSNLEKLIKKRFSKAEN